MSISTNGRGYNVKAITLVTKCSKERIPEYWVWHNMKQRCLNSKLPNYKNYGARGVKVCKRWLGKKGFTNFLADMGNRPTGKMVGGKAKYSISRINNAMVYSKRTCTWATCKEQCAPGQRRHPKTP